MNSKIDLNKLKNEIENRKNNRNTVSSKLGENVGTGVAPRDTFLNGLIESLHTGRDTSSSILVKTVDNKVAEKKGESSKLQINNNINERPRINEMAGGQSFNDDNIEMSQERDELLFAEFEKRKNRTLAESIGSYISPSVNSATPPNPNTGVPMNLNEAYLSESVKRIVNNYLIENFGPVVEEAINSTILEMFAVERIKHVLHENRDLVKTIVVEVIREIQAKNKANQK